GAISDFPPTRLSDVLLSEHLVWRRGPRSRRARSRLADPYPPIHAQTGDPPPPRIGPTSCSPSTWSGDQVLDHDAPAAGWLIHTHPSTLKQVTPPTHASFRRPALRAPGLATRSSITTRPEPAG